MLQFARRKPPFGIAQVGKSFRNEITPGNFIFRTLEFEQMEMEFFVPPAEAQQWHEHWLEARMDWYAALGIRPDHLRLRPHDADELSHYSSATSDVEYLYPIGWSELEGIANRGDFDLTQHAQFSGEKLEYFDQQTGERYVPHVIEPAAGVGRSVLAFLCDAYDEDELGGEQRTVLKLHPALAPVKVAVLPLLRKDGHPEARPRDPHHAQARGPAERVRRGRLDRQALPPPGRDRHALRRHRRPPDARGRHRHVARPRHARPGADRDRLRSRTSCSARLAAPWLLAEAGLTDAGQTGYVPLHMGEDVAARIFSREDRQRYRQKVRACLDVFARMLAESRFDPERRSMGLEIELNLTDETGDPAMLNAAVLEAIADNDFTTELAQFNVEINIPPRLLDGRVFSELEAQVRGSLNNAEDKARGAGAHMMLVGILPTISDQHLNAEALSANPRYRLLNEQIFAARGEDLQISIAGQERLSTFADTIAPEAACTSVQLHQMVDPEKFATHWNAAQAIAGVQLAVGANSPFFFARELWRETRIALFEQATDTRPEELKAQGVRPRVWFGERWITSIFDLFEENVTYFPALLPVCEPEDPAAVLHAGGVPSLAELRLHNGTVYRWNRPVYDVVRGKPHLRVENRVLPAGPTVVDTLANAAFYYGLVRMLADEDRPIWSRMSFSAAEENFHAGARDGIDANVFWPGLGEVPASELVLRRLLPLAHEGLDRWVDRRRRPRPPARHHRAALHEAAQRRARGRPRRSTGSTTTRGSSASRRCAR